MKYITSTLIKRAKQLANFDNSTFISFGEMFQYLNAAYRNVYVDVINAGDYNYLREVKIGSGDYALPDDFFQLAYIKSGGLDLERDYDYRIANGLISCKCDAKLGYFPIPETITFKPEKKEIGSLPITPISAWDSLLIDNYSQIYDFKKNEFVRSIENPSETGSYILGGNTYLDVTSKKVYDFEGNEDFTYTTPILRTDGTFNEDIYTTDHQFGWGNEDGSVEYTVNEGNLYYTDEDGTNLIAENYTPGLNAKILYFKDKFVLVDLKRINYPDGSWETTDVPKAKVILETSMDTGYGYLEKDGLKYFLTGFMPETKIDFPSNIFFDIVAYDIAIQARVKANSDTTELRNAYADRLGQYVSTLSADAYNVPQVRNVLSPFGQFGGCF